MVRSGLSGSNVELKQISVPERGYTDIAPELWASLQKSEDFRCLHKEGVLEVAYLPMGRIRLNGTCYVGHAICGDILLECREKIDGALMALLPHTSHKAFRIAHAHAASSDLGELVVLLVAQFLDAVTRYVSTGRLFSYTTTKAVGSLVGGRLNITKSLQLRARGLGHMLAFEKNIVTFNIPVNKVVLAALAEIERLARIVRLPDHLISRSRGLSMLFSDCRDHETLYRERIFFTNLAISISEGHHAEPVKDMMALAGIILAHESFESSIEKIAGAPRTWFLNLENLFEAAVRKVLSVVLRDGIQVFRGEQSPPPIFSVEQKKYRANPDLVLSDGETPLAVGDVKYKVFDGSAASSDVYQLLAHTEAFGAKKAFLVFPGEQYSCRHIGATRKGIEAWFFSVRVTHLEEDLRDLAAHLGCADSVKNELAQATNDPLSAEEWEVLLE